MIIKVIRVDDGIREQVIIIKVIGVDDGIREQVMIIKVMMFSESNKHMCYCTGEYLLQKF